MTILNYMYSDHDEEDTSWRNQAYFRGCEEASPKARNRKMRHTEEDLDEETEEDSE
jgi:hypothetical protein